VFARRFSLVQSDGCVHRGLACIRPQLLSASSFCPYPRRPWWQWDVFARMRTDKRVFARRYFPLSIRRLRMFNRKGLFARRLRRTTVSARTPITPRSKTQPSPRYSRERAPFSDVFSDDGHWRSRAGMVLTGLCTASVPGVYFLSRKGGGGPVC